MTTGRSRTSRSRRLVRRAPSTGRMTTPARPRCEWTSSTPGGDDGAASTETYTEYYTDDGSRVGGAFQDSNYTGKLIMTPINQSEYGPDQYDEVPQTVHMLEEGHGLTLIVQTPDKDDPVRPVVGFDSAGNAYWRDDNGNLVQANPNGLEIFNAEGAAIRAVSGDGGGAPTIEAVAGVIPNPYRDGGTFHNIWWDSLTLEQKARASSLYTTYEGGYREGRGYTAGATRAYDELKEWQDQWYDSLPEEVRDNPNYAYVHTNRGNPNYEAPAPEDHPALTDPNHPNYRPPEQQGAGDSADPIAADGTPEVDPNAAPAETPGTTPEPQLSSGTGFFEQDTVLDGSLGTVEDDIEDAAATVQETQPPPPPRQSRDDDDDEDALILDDTSGFGGGGYQGPGLVGNEDADASEFSFENPDEPEVAPNNEIDDYNQDDLATATLEDSGTFDPDTPDVEVDTNYFDDQDQGNEDDVASGVLQDSRSFTDEDKEDAAGQDFDLDYTDDHDVPSGEDDTQNLGRSFTDEDKEDAAGQDFDLDYTDDRDVPSGEDDTQNLGRSFTDEDKEDAAGQDFDLDYTDDRDVPSGEDDTQNLGRSFTDEDKEDAAGQNFDLDYTDDAQSGE